MECEIILIGNELLIGKTVDTNGQWLISQTRPLGIEISRITIIRDKIDEIKSAIYNAILRSPEYIITSGGLGPTFDDMTLEGVAAGLTPPRNIIQNPVAFEMIRNRYRKIYREKNVDKIMTPAREKMAQLPEGGIPLSNSEGTAPGVCILPSFTNSHTTIYCLPGVPRELKAIFMDHIYPKFKEEVKDITFYECGFVFSHLGESKFTELVSDIVKNNEYPEIWIKTHPRAKETKQVELHLTSFTQNPDIIHQMSLLYNQLIRYAKQNGANIESEKPLKK